MGETATNDSCNLNHQNRKRHETLLGLTAEKKRKLAVKTASKEIEKEVKHVQAFGCTKRESQQKSGPYFQRLEYKPLKKGHFNVRRKIMKQLIALLMLVSTCVAGEDDTLPKIDIAKFTNLRLNYAKRKGFTPAWKILDARQALAKAYTQRDWKKVAVAGKNWLDQCPVDAEAHKMRAVACAGQNDWAGFHFHMHYYYGLLASITASGDGRTKETAMKVISVSEEYAVLEHLVERKLGQSLDESGRYDIMECEADGQKVTYYFDVSIPRDAMRREFEAIEKKTPNKTN